MNKITSSIYSAVRNKITLTKMIMKSNVSANAVKFCSIIG